MAINYNFIAYCSKISPTNWIIGMKAIHGEVPLDVVIPDSHVPPDPDNPELVGVLTTEGIGTGESRRIRTLPLSPAVEPEEK